MVQVLDPAAVMEEVMLVNMEMGTVEVVVVVMAGQEATLLIPTHEKENSY